MRPSDVGVRRRGPAKHLTDFVWLLWSELFLLRTAWFWYFVQLALVPVVYVFFLWILVGRNRPEAMVYAVIGGWVTTISTGAMLSLGQHVGALKSQHAYEYYATLPISKAVFVAAVTTRGVLLALPSLVIVMLVSALAFGIAVPPPGIGILVLSAYAMAGLGAFIGFWSPTGQAANLATQVLATLITFLAPVFVPREALPAPLQVISLIWPTTHAALALSAIVRGAPLTTYWSSLVVLLLCAIVSIGLVPRKLDWRAE